MKTVLWISRHEMTQAQRTDLERVLCGAVRLVPWRDTVCDTEQLRAPLEAADAVAAVLPPKLLSELLRTAGGKPVLQALSARRPTGRMLTLSDGRCEPEFDFVHDGWEQILRLKIETLLL